MTTDKLTRREVLAGVAGAALAATACAPEQGSAQRAPSTGRGEQGSMGTTASTRLPVIYLPHGGGPWPFVDLGMGDPRELERLAGYLRGLASIATPRAVLVISAHWEERVPTVMTSPRPPMLYDYYGFPPESYTITWPAPGSPELASRVRSLLAAAGIETAEDPSRGFDHGAFVPLKLTYPSADVPTIQLSLKAGLDPATHLAIGRALAPLRDEGVLIVGSGMSYHNMRGFGRASATQASVEFDDWLSETVALPAAERDARLTAWASAPRARECHPREEHLLPLMVIAGAAGADRGASPYRESLMGVRIAAAHFG
ncbi:MAG: class III extradiol ring-cleavage dioxygenase [Sandaracinus sp.]